MYRQSTKDKISFLESEILHNCPSVTHAFLTRWSGISEGNFSSLNFSTSVGDLATHVTRNWEILAEAFDIPVSQFLMINQVHGDRVLIADDLTQRSSLDHPISCDAVLTTKRGLALGIKTADCVPILLFDGVKGIVGAVHAGWRGTVLNIAVKTVQTMIEAFQCNPSDILTAIGPAIGSCCYQVDEQVYTAFSKEASSYASAFRACNEQGKWMLDLAWVNRMHLLQSGIPENNISSTGLCTSCRTDIFFSHRAEKGTTGRQLNLIVIK
jgi:hypothetical protein